MRSDEKNQMKADEEKGKDIRGLVCSRIIMISDDGQDDKSRWYLEDFKMMILQI